jgi:nickel/cobalt exporter
MNPIDLAEQAGSSPWLFLGAALLLGMLHGLEPGHSKGIMTAFIVGTRGTYTQAVILALCATLSHTAIVWILVWPASYGGAICSGLAFSPWLNLISGIIILALAYWMLRRFNQPNHGYSRDHVHDHSHSHHGHAHGHSHDHSDHDHGDHGHGHIHGHGHHDHSHDNTRSHEDAHAKEPAISNEALSVAIEMEDDEHARHHMQEIAQKFSGQDISTAQVAVFGLSTGLAPCSAAIVILITCFRLHQPWLGLGLVVAFSFGLGLTLTSVALLASWGVRTLGDHTLGFQKIVSKAPFLSALVTAAIGFYLIIQFFRTF